MNPFRIVESILKIGSMQFHTSPVDEKDELGQFRYRTQLYCHLPAIHSFYKSIQYASSMLLLKKHAHQQPGFLLPAQTDIANETLQDFDVLHTDNALVHKINNTVTVGGFLLLSQRLTGMPSVADIQREQVVLQRLLSAEKEQGAIEKLRAVLTNFKKHENIVLSFWHDQSHPGVMRDELAEMLKHKRLKSFFGYNLHWLNQQPSVCFIMELFALCKAPFYWISTLIAPVGLGLMFGFKAALLATIAGFPAIFFVLSSLPQEMKELQKKILANYFMFQKMLAMRSIIADAQTIHTLLHESDISFDGADLLPAPATGSNRLHALLQSKTFNAPLDAALEEKPSWLFHWGRVHVAYRLFNASKEQFVALYAAMATVDRLVCQASLLMNEQYCFAQFISSDVPVLHLSQAWCPLLSIDNKDIVRNDITLGTQDNPGTILITGPNSRGKTTNLRTAGIAALMAQTLGIAPARSCVLSAPLHIQTSINVTDNIADNISQFRSESQRAGALLARSATEHHQLLLIDEPFKGTKQHIGQAASCQLLHQIATKPNTLAMFTSHHNDLAEYANQLPECENYYVRTDSDNAYKLQKGIGAQEEYDATAMNILHEHIDHSFAYKVAQLMTTQNKNNKKIESQDSILKARNNFINHVV